MSTYLLAWNPKKWEWKDAELTAKILDVQAIGHADDSWSCGNRQDLPVGSRFFLIRLGGVPRGIVGSGVTTTEPELGPHWDSSQRRFGKEALFVRIKFDFLSKEPLISWSELNKSPFSGMRWGIQASGVAVPTPIASSLERLWARRTGGEGPLLPDELPPDREFPEGACKKVTVNAYERNPQARAACIAYFGYGCSVCDVTLEEIYGSIASEFIHVHHTKQLAGVPSNYKVNPRKDLRPVCPNCHAILHRRRPPLSIEKARRLVRKRKSYVCNREDR